MKNLNRRKNSHRMGWYLLLKGSIKVKCLTVKISNKLSILGLIKIVNSTWASLENFKSTNGN